VNPDPDIRYRIPDVGQSILDGPKFGIRHRTSWIKQEIETIPNNEQRDANEARA
jgi:hypothetical protein